MLGNKRNWKMRTFTLKKWVVQAAVTDNINNISIHSLATNISHMYVVTPRKLITSDIVSASIYINDYTFCQQQIIYRCNFLC